jgi:hypothetical protein
MIATGNGPTTEAGWTGVRGEAYWRVYQDWREWTREGILDIAMPMNYKLEHNAAQKIMFDEWSEWLKNHQYDRSGMIGTAGVTTLPNGNSVEGALRQTRRALAPSSTGKSAVGVIHFSMANSNAAVTNNPFALPAVATTPVRTFAQFASGLTTGKSGTTLFEDPVANPVAIFNQPAFIPDFPWKSAPTKGHLKGFATPLLDTAAVTIENAGTGATRTTATDGSGFYGGVDLVPGQYFVKATQGSTSLFGCITSVSAGSVSTLDLAADTTAPTISVNPVTVPNDAGLCAAAVAWTTNASDSCLPVSVVSKLADGSVVAPGSSFPVGTTTVTATATDRAGNSTSADFTVTVLDTEAPVIGAVTTNKSTIWPPNSQMVNVRVMYSASDNCSVTTRLSVTSDEEGADDWTVVDEHTVELRAERAGNDGDRTYTITVTATDPAGNETTASVNVVVPHDMR